MVANAPIHAFLLILLTSKLHNILSKPLAALPHNYCRKKQTVVREMNSVAMTTMNLRKEYWPSRGSNLRPLKFGNQHFLLSSKCFQKAFSLWASKVIFDQ